MKTKSDFKFNYSAPSSEERKEIESIRNSYLSQTSSSKGKLETLRKLDNKVKNTPNTIALIVGIVGILIFGLGMTMVLEWKLLLWGIIVGIIGFVTMILAYPIFKFTFKMLKDKYSSQILSLSEELLNEQLSTNE